MPRSGRAQLRSLSAVFAALGDETRLGVLTTLAHGHPQSISQLTAGTKLSRQAVTKHLRVLENAGLVQSVRDGRESRFEFTPARIDEARKDLEYVAQQWADSLQRLKSFVEET